MLTIHELLEDPVYRKYFLTVPRLPDVQRTVPPWRLYVKRGGRWMKRDFEKYAEAVKLFNRLRSVGLQDATVTCRPVAFAPPSRIVRIKGKFQTNARGQYILDAQGQKKPITREVFWKAAVPADEEEHTWCPYCRRPTVFNYFSTHHAIVGAHKYYMDPSARRCTICGIRLQGIGQWAKR